MPKITDLRPARRNANKHTARGLFELDKSIRGDGWIGAMTTTDRRRFEADPPAPE